LARVHPPTLTLTKAENEGNEDRERVDRIDRCGEEGEEGEDEGNEDGEEGEEGGEEAQAATRHSAQRRLGAVVHSPPVVVVLLVLIIFIFIFLFLFLLLLLRRRLLLSIAREHVRRSLSLLNDIQCSDMGSYIHTEKSTSSPFTLSLDAVTYPLSTTMYKCVSGTCTGNDPP
jgi:hypothetical protein